MEKEEKPKTEEKVREKVLVPVKRHETIGEEENLEKPVDKTWKIPRRWYVH